MPYFNKKMIDFVVCICCGRREDERISCCRSCGWSLGRLWGVFDVVADENDGSTSCTNIDRGIDGQFMGSGFSERVEFIASARYESDASGTRCMRALLIQKK